MEKSRIPFGVMPDKRLVEEVILRAGTISCSILTYGGAVKNLWVPDQNGKLTDVVLGFDSLGDYIRQDKYIGALIGRYANRIGGASFSLNGVEYHLRANDGPNHLHGGPMGFDKQLWTIEALTENTLVLTLTSPDGQEGYPGDLTARITYTLTKDGLEIDYRAQCDQDTLCNLTNHSYFNLSGHDSGLIIDQQIQLFADRYTPIGPGSIPTGELAPVEGTPMDLRMPIPIGKHMDDGFEQLMLAGGYDHNWVINGWDGTLIHAAKAWSPRTGITLEMLTTLPGIQFYSGNYLDGCPVGKGGAPYTKRWGFCLEAQFFPDSIHCEVFPSPVLRAGKIWHYNTCYHFGVKDREGWLD